MDAGFEKTLLETGAFREEPKPEHEWVNHLLERYRAAGGFARRWNLRRGPQDRCGARPLSGLAVRVTAEFSHYGG